MTFKLVKLKNIGLKNETYRSYSCTTFTFCADHSLNLECVPQQAAHLAACGVNGAFVAGTTGECHSLTTAERAQLFAAWGEAAREHGVIHRSHWPQ